MTNETALREALARQCENMAFVLNRASLPDQWYSKFMRELESDKAALLQSPSQPVVAEAVEPVAYLYHKPGGAPMASTNLVEWQYGVTPLYTHPQASPPPVQSEPAFSQIPPENISKGQPENEKVNSVQSESDVEDRARSMLNELVGPHSDTALRVATDYLKQEHRLAHSQPDTQEGEESRRLRIGWWNDMRKRGVTQDDAIAKINAALRGKVAQQQEQQP